MAKIQQKCYVLDTNILVDYSDLIPEPGAPKIELEESTIDLDGERLVIPSVVIMELSNFKKEYSERGKAARLVLDRISNLLKSNLAISLLEAYKMGATVELKQTNQLLTILPVHKGFKKSFPFSPAATDMDGQIILATFATSYALKDVLANDEIPEEKLLHSKPKNVVLLTNDKGLAIRARGLGLITSNYSYKQPEPYTGRRDVVVSKDLLTAFWVDRCINLEDWQDFLPNQPKLIANEFVVMHLTDGETYPDGYNPENDHYFTNIGRYDIERRAIVPLEYVRSCPVYPKTIGQATYAEALMNPNISAVICTGPAGSGKTYMATIYGYKACKNGDFIDVMVVPCESRSKLGALPGDLNDKMDQDVQPMKNAIRNYLLKEDKEFRKELDNIGKTKSEKSGCPGKSDGGNDKKSLKTRLEERVNLIWNNWFGSIPIENARGRDFACELAIYDEFQDQSIKQADTLLKRIGKGGKIIITGDIAQIHAPYLDYTNNGLAYASRLLYDDKMVAQVHFVEEDVVRHPLVEMIAKRQKARRSAKNI